MSPPDAATRSRQGASAGAAAGEPPPRGPAAWKADLALLGITAIWGVTFVVVKRALADASPLAFNAARLLLAAVLLVAVYRRQVRRLAGKVWGAGALVGLFMALGYAFQTMGLEYTTPAKSAFLTGLSVIIVPFYAAVWLRRAPGAGTYCGALLALAGLYFLAFARGAGGGWTAANWGDLLTLACAAAFAGHIVALGEFTVRFPFEQLAVLQVGFAALFTSAGALAIEHIRLRWTPELIAALAITAVLATALAFTVQAWAQQFTPASHTAIVFAAEPVFAWVTSLSLGLEAFTAQVALGAGLILAAIVTVEFWKPRRGA
ncbi:MAG TPA: DMT family transporter [Terriglobales bacterium]|nr:DMT family transporter [Terriglobales bacterium]